MSDLNPPKAHDPLLGQGRRNARIPALTPEPSLGKTCPKGKRLVKGFRRKDGTMAGAFCAPAAKPSAAPLGRWKKDASDTTRRRALKKLAGAKGCEQTAALLGKAVASDPSAKEVVEKDLAWLRKRSCPRPQGEVT